MCKAKGIDRMYTFLGVEGFKDFQFKEVYDPHGEGVNACDSEPDGVLVAA